MIEKEIYNQLLDYVLHLETPATNRERLEKARPYFGSLSAKNVMDLVDDVMKRIKDISRVKIIVTRLLHSFNNSINKNIRNFDRSLPPIEELLHINLAEKIFDTFFLHHLIGL